MVEEKVALLSSLIGQLSDTSPKSVAEIDGERDEVLIGLRDLLFLGFIRGEFSYCAQSDVIGPLLGAAERVLLTRRGRAFQC